MLHVSIARASSLLGSIFFVILFALVAFPPQPLLATASGCRIDPIVYFTDGTKLTITANIGSDPARVKKVRYKLHAPHETRIQQIQFVNLDVSPGTVDGLTAGAAVDSPTIPEQVDFKGDAKKSVYWVEVQADTLDDNVPLAVQMTLANGMTSTANGLAKDHVRVTLTNGNIHVFGSNPVVQLTDGTTLTLGTSIATLATSLKEVKYKLHTPHGVKLAQVTDPYGKYVPESFEMHDDAQPKTYWSEMQMDTGSGFAQITFDMQLDALTFGSDQGQDKEKLTVVLLKGSRIQ